MADIELVIKIPEEEYEDIKYFGTIVDESRDYIANIILSGIPLPKGHGDLIDKSEAIISLFDYYNGKKTIGQCIDGVPTIIESDKEVHDAHSN